jgi:hypothetical protein
MRKVNEVLRLRFELGLEQRAIARACSISQSTVHEYLKKAAAAGIGWPLKEGWDQRSWSRPCFRSVGFPSNFPNTCFLIFLPCINNCSNIRT